MNRINIPLALIACVPVIGWVEASGAAETNNKAECALQSDGFSRYEIQNGEMHLFPCGGGEISLPRESGQIGITSPLISKDRRMAGWLVNYQDDGVSYPVAGTLVVYRSDDEMTTRITVPDDISDWRFLKGNKEVAITHGPLHFSDPVEEVYLLEPVSRKEVNQ